MFSEHAKGALRFTAYFVVIYLLSIGIVYYVCQP